MVIKTKTIRNKNNIQYIGTKAQSVCALFTYYLIYFSFRIRKENPAGARFRASAWPTSSSARRKKTSQSLTQKVSRNISIEPSLDYIIKLFEF